MNRTPSKLKAALWMAGFLSLMLLMMISGREAARELPVFQIMELRSGLGLLILCPVIYLAGGFGMLRTSRLPTHAARALLHYAGQYGWFLALTLIPLAQVVAIEFTMPLWTALLAAAVLGDRGRARAGLPAGPAVAGRRRTGRGHRSEDRCPHPAAGHRPDQQDR